MALTKFGFIVSGKDLDPATHRMTMASSGFMMIAIGVSRPEDGVQVARELAGESIQLLELCGGFGPKWTAKILMRSKRKFLSAPWAMVLNPLRRCMPCSGTGPVKAISVTFLRRHVA